MCFPWELPGAGAVLTPPAAAQGPIRPCCAVSVAAVRTVAHRLVILLQVEQCGRSPSGAGVLPQGETSPGRLLTYLACSPCGKGRTVLSSNLLVPDFQNSEPVPYHPFEMGPTASVSAITTLVHFRYSARKHSRYVVAFAYGQSPPRPVTGPVRAELGALAASSERTGGKRHIKMLTEGK